MPDTLCVIAFNLQDDASDHPAVFDTAHELLAEHHPDVLLRQEISTQARCDDAATALGMRGWMTPTKHLRHHTGILINSNVFTVDTVFAHDKRWRIPATFARVGLVDVPERHLHLASWHTAFDSIAARRLEADDLTGLVEKVEDRPGRIGTNLLGGGDCNSYPVPTTAERVGPIDWTDSSITKLVHRWHRAEQHRDGQWVSDTYLDRMMRTIGMHDAARLAARRGLRPDAAPTAGHAPTAAGQGGPRRIDRIYLDRWLAAAITDVDVIDTSGLSDHHAVKVMLDRAGFAAALRRQLRPEPVCLAA